MDELSIMKWAMMIPIALLIFAVVIIGAGYLFYDEVQYSGYIEDVRFAGGGLGSPDMMYIYFEDGQVISVLNDNQDIRIKVNATITVHKSSIMLSRIVDIEYT